VHLRSLDDLGCTSLPGRSAAPEQSFWPGMIGDDNVAPLREQSA
jgi:hypothetical protein